jgi:hypothetical protein
MLELLAALFGFVLGVGVLYGLYRHIVSSGYWWPF